MLTRIIDSHDVFDKPTVLPLYLTLISRGFLSVDSNLHNPPRLAFAICGLCMYLFFVTKVLETNKVRP